MGFKKQQKNKSKNNKKDTKSTNKYKNNSNFNEEKRKKRANKSKEYFSSFQKDMNSIGLRIKEVNGDGNCLFRSISDQFEGNENNHFHYRNLTCDYIQSNREFIQFFIEDDITIDDYISRMRQNSIWGGHIELYCLSIGLIINFYVFMHNRPVYVIKNHDNPHRNIFLSYHDGMHYNSIRLINDFTENETPLLISLDLLTGIKQSQEIGLLEDNDNDNDNDIDEDSNDNINEEHKVSKEDNDINNKNELKYKNISIVDSSNIPKSIKTKQKILSEEGILYNITNKKCYCSSSKKYKNCHFGKDILGEYDEDSNIFYCDLNRLKEIFKYSSLSHKDKDKERDISDKETSIIQKKIEMIYI